MSAYALFVVPVAYYVLADLFKWAGRSPYHAASLTILVATVYFS
jgi:hypothetical protein